MTKLPDSKLIKELADLLDKSSLTEIEVEAEGMRIRVCLLYTSPSPRD